MLAVRAVVGCIRALSTSRAATTSSVSTSTANPASNKVSSSVRTLGSQGLSDFVDASVPFGEVVTAKVGRAWRAAEFRLKSFDDLWKLWFVLLKERNMLESEKLKYKSAHMNTSTVNDRIKKVKLSQARLKFVVWERKLDQDRAKGIVPSKKAQEEKDLAKGKKRKAASHY